MSEFMKTVLITKPTAWDFSRKIHRLFHLIIHRQCASTQSTHQPSLCLSGLPATRQLAGQSCAVTKISILTEENASLCHPAHPPGDNFWDPYLVSASSQTPGLSAASLLDASPLGFRRTTEASLPAIAGRQAKKFCCKVDTVFINSDIYWQRMS